MKTEIIPSKYQQDIFEFGKNKPASGEQRNCIIKATAGSGKTTTIKLLYKYLTGNSVFVAFGVDIVATLKSSGLNARTFNSLGAEALRYYFGKNQPILDNNKLYKICKQLLTKDQIEKYQSFVIKLVNIARNMGVDCLLSNTNETWLQIVDDHGMYLDTQGAILDDAIEISKNVLERSIAIAPQIIDYTDQIYLPIKLNLNFRKYDNILGDEIQDTCPVQIEILKKMTNNWTRFFGVGDFFQSIFFWRGADSSAMDNVKNAFNCKEFPLSISYRCPKKIVEFAKEWCESIEAAPNAIEGELNFLDENWQVTDFQPNDLVLCRTTAPVVRLAYKLLKQRIPVEIRGKQIQEGLEALVKKMNAHSIENLIEKLRKYTAREVKIAKDADEMIRAETIQDKTDAVMCFIDGLSEDEYTVNGLMDAIKFIFQNKDKAVIFSTIHKAKGLEFDTVWWLNKSQQPSKWARKPAQIKEENNLCFVASTRAKKKLNLIELANPNKQD